MKWTNERVSKTQRLVGVKILPPTSSLPRNVLGKVIKKDLRDPYWRMRVEERFWEERQG